ncbi:MAG TPA: DJ-1/PfpI family protein [Acidimicrobiales bacterium]|nr:DJ-1/PfpI family protein [Acidimicrobiales bacterium]
MTDAPRRHIGILLFDDVEELDAVGPYEVLAAWASYFPDDGWSVATMSASGDAVRGAKGLRMLPHHAVADAPALDVLVYPGGIGTRALLADPAHLEWVRAQRAAVPILATVCTGSLVLAAAGLLANRPATTHWASLDTLGELDPTIDVRRDVRFVDDGDTVTSAGVSAGIDMALHLVARLASTTTAVAVRRGLQYDPVPPV